MDEVVLQQQIQSTMNKFKLFTILAAATVVFSSCEKDEETTTPTPTPEAPAAGTVIVTSNITGEVTWTAGNVYQLAGRIVVTNGATLTIEKGTVIKGEAGTGANATALLVARGGKIFAEGTATEPIIFTSVADEITNANILAGNFNSPNLEADVNGLWGGVIILGNAPISASNSNGDVSEVQIEGIPTSDANGLYGGSNPADNSGVFKYVSIRHGGTNIGNGNEINGLTLGGVGSGTVIDHVEIVGNQDDGVEFFGGTVNASNIVVWNCGDDGIDTDQSWAGTLDNFVVVGATGHAFELDGPEGSMLASHIIRNGSVRANYNDRITADLINTDANSRVSLENIYITDISAGQMINRVNAPEVFYTNIILNVTADALPTHVNGEVPSSIITGTTPQADISVFGWTWASSANAMSGL